MKKKTLINVILALLLLVSLYRVADFINFTSVASLQMDFTAYYTAGKVFLAGEDIYKNQVVNDWLMWDGVALFFHSRFLYPPLTAAIFSVFSHLGFSSAKYLWTVLNFLLISASLLILLIAFMKKLNFLKISVAFIVLLNFFPFWTMLERGQVDGLNLFLITMAIMLTTGRKFFTVGLILSVATLFKLYIVLLIPFMFILSGKKVVKGYVLGLAVVASLSLFIAGLEKNMQYVFEEVPRISQLGESGYEYMQIPLDALRNWSELSKYAVTVVEGKMYRTEVISFNSKASFLRIISIINEKTHLNLPLALISLSLYLVFLYFIAKLVRKRGIHDGSDHLMFWIISIVTILLCSNFTWVMNLVWLVPVIVFLLIKIKETRTSQPIYYALMLFGFLLAAMPDDLHMVKGITIIEYFFKVKYVLALVLIFSGCISYFLQQPVTEKVTT